jgi:hypothetical protein
MALAITRATGGDYVAGNKRTHVRNVALSGSYSTGGETITPTAVGLKRIEQVFLHGSAAETDLTGGWITRVDYQTNGSVKLVLFEAAAAGGVFTQKPAEAYESAASLRVTFVGV